MKFLNPHTFDHVLCAKELAEFKKTLLDAKVDLSETDDIRPFFEKNRNMAAFIGSYFPYINKFDLIADQLSLVGDYSCDLVIGDSSTKTYCLVEFEDATDESIFCQNGKKANREYSDRFEHGFSQIVDWLCVLDDIKRTDIFKKVYGDKAEFYGMLVLGRSGYLKAGEQDVNAGRKVRR